MAQNRDAPAFQEYASSMMATVAYRTMTLAERGLLYSLRLECWVNRRLPADPAKLARVIGFDALEVQRALPAVMPFFDISDEEIFSPELDDYRAYLEDRHERQSKGGKRGAEKTNDKRKAAPDKGGRTATATPTGNPQAPRRVLSTAKPRSDQSKPTQPSESDVPSTNEWVRAYEKASNGE